MNAISEGFNSYSPAEIHRLIGRPLVSERLYPTHKYRRYRRSVDASSQKACAQSQANLFYSFRSSARPQDCLCDLIWTGFVLPHCILHSPSPQCLCPCPLTAVCKVVLKLQICILFILKLPKLHNVHRFANTFYYYNIHVLKNVIQSCTGYQNNVSNQEVSWSIFLYKRYTKVQINIHKMVYMSTLVYNTKAAR